MITEHDIENALDYLRDHAVTAAQATATRVYLQEFRKSLKAQLRAQSDARTEGAKDDFAYAHPDYLKHLEAMRIAVEQDERHRYLIKAAAAKIDAWRTQQANERGQARVG